MTEEAADYDEGMLNQNKKVFCDMGFKEIARNICEEEKNLRKNIYIYLENLHGN